MSVARGDSAAGVAFNPREPRPLHHSSKDSPSSNNVETHPVFFILISLILTFFHYMP